jgi:hypothetical protein
MYSTTTRQQGNEENPAPEAATTVTTENPIMSGTPGARPYEASTIAWCFPASSGSKVMSNSMLAAGKQWDWWEENNLLSEDGMIMNGSHVYYMFTITRQQGESTATWLLETTLVFQSLAFITPIFQNYLGKAP